VRREKGERGGGRILTSLTSKLTWFAKVRLGRERRKRRKEKARRPLVPFSLLSAWTPTGSRSSPPWFPDLMVREGRGGKKGFVGRKGGKEKARRKEGAVGHTGRLWLLCGFAPVDEFLSNGGEEEEKRTSKGEGGSEGEEEKKIQPSTGSTSTSSHIPSYHPPLGSSWGEGEKEKLLHKKGGKRGAARLFHPVGLQHISPKRRKKGLAREKKKTLPPSTGLFLVLLVYHEDGKEEKVPGRKGRGKMEGRKRPGPSLFTNILILLAGWHKRGEKKAARGGGGGGERRAARRRCCRLIVPEERNGSCGKRRKEGGTPGKRQKEGEAVTRRIIISPSFYFVEARQQLKKERGKKRKKKKRPSQRGGGEKKKGESPVGPRRSTLVTKCTYSNRTEPPPRGKGGRKGGKQGKAGGGRSVSASSLLSLPSTPSPAATGRRFGEKGGGGREGGLSAKGEGGVGKKRKKAPLPARAQKNVVEPYY